MGQQCSTSTDRNDPSLDYPCNIIFPDYYVSDASCDANNGSLGDEVVHTYSFAWVAGQDPLGCGDYHWAAELDHEVKCAHPRFGIDTQSAQTSGFAAGSGFFFWGFEDGVELETYNGAYVTDGTNSWNPTCTDNFLGEDGPVDGSYFEDDDILIGWNDVGAFSPANQQGKWSYECRVGSNGRTYDQSVWDSQNQARNQNQHEASLSWNFVCWDDTNEEVVPDCRCEGTCGC